MGHKWFYFEGKLYFANPDMRSKLPTVLIDDTTLSRGLCFVYCQGSFYLISEAKPLQELLNEKKNQGRLRLVAVHGTNSPMQAAIPYTFRANHGK